MAASARNPESRHLHLGGACENDDPLLCFFVFASSTVSLNLKACELETVVCSQPTTRTHTLISIQYTEVG